MRQASFFLTIPHPCLFLPALTKRSAPKKAGVMSPLLISWGALFARLPGVLCARATFFLVFSCITVRDPCFVACPRSMTQFYG